MLAGLRASNSLGRRPCKGAGNYWCVFVSRFPPPEQGEGDPLTSTCRIHLGFVKDCVTRISPGCAGSISSRSHLLIVVRRGRGWKIYLGFGLHLIVS